MKGEIMLGDEVKDIYTGFKGVAMSRTEFINGCVQWGVAPKWNPKAPAAIESFAEVGVDSQNLELTKKGKKHLELEKNRNTEILDALETDDEPIGGPMRRAPTTSRRIMRK